NTKGPGTAEPCGAGTGPDSRPRQRTPFNWLQRSGNQGEPREPALPPSGPRTTTTLPAPACRRLPPPGTWLLRNGRSAAANHQDKPATTADRPR
ncbi:hypothetical protein Q9R30_19300, partial [Arthrobacter sp. AB6]|uniref:hypothetical protein n=1 Tax=Arthrobacter sp. AB6 TaxID=2962570 RepID=UPI00288188A6